MIRQSSNEKSKTLESVTCAFESQLTMGKITTSGENIKFYEFNTFIVFSSPQLEKDCFKKLFKI